MSERKTTTPKSGVPGSSLLAGCACTNEWQDTKYGRFVRVHNYTAPLREGEWARCTCCGNVKRVD